MLRDNRPMSIGGSLMQCRDAVEASWIGPRLMSFASGVGAWVPPVFEAYARILHPAGRGSGGLVRWAEVAMWSGGTVHALAQFHEMARPRGSLGRDSELPARPFDTPPRNGVLEPATLAALCETLGRHTTVPESCYFGVWEGFGWASMVDGPAAPAATVHPAAPVLPAARLELPAARLELPAARLELPERTYLLFRGPLSAVGEVGWAWTNGFDGTAGFSQESPSLMWPSDRSWFVATEVDLDSTFVGGSARLIDELLADERLEAWPVSATDPTDAGSDRINRDG